MQLPMQKHALHCFDPIARAAISHEAAYLGFAICLFAVPDVGLWNVAARPAGRHFE